jgi:RNAse (barnase) inhibitor barstar
MPFPEDAKKTIFSQEPKFIMQLSGESKSTPMRIESLYKMTAPSQAHEAPQVAQLLQSGGDMSLLKSVPPNLVQSIRAFRVTELQEEAARLGQHFLYAFCANAVTRQQVMTTIAQAFCFPRHFGKNGDLLEDCLTNLAFKAGPQPGFLVVLEQLPNTQKFDKEARETLLDVFRDAADFWAEKKIAFRVFYSFQ